jgi:putative heme transporter
MRRRWVRIVAGVGSVGLAAVMLVVALPRITGVRWSQIAAQLGGLHPSTMATLGLIWFAGLWVYTFVLTGSLPGLRHAQALVLNVAGSAISNVLPFGGAAGVALTFTMAGSWGHSKRAITASTLVSGAWNVLFRLALPALGLAALVLSGHVPDRRLTTAATVAVVVLICAVGTTVPILTLRQTPAWLRPAVRRLWPALQWPVLRRLQRVLAAVGQLRLSTVDIIRHGWPRLTIGMVGYLGLQYLLFWACLNATSARVGVSATLAAFGLSRILATTSITPGGIGVTESGTAALLVTLGAPGAPAAAALVLFGFFTHILEIPAGGLGLLTWATATRWRTGRHVADDARVPASRAGDDGNLRVGAGGQARN